MSDRTRCPNCNLVLSSMLDAEALAYEVAVLVRSRAIDPRSPAGDALLCYRDPPSSERADRLAAADRKLGALRLLAQKMDGRTIDDAPPEMGHDEASAWVSGQQQAAEAILALLVGED